MHLQTRSATAVANFVDFCAQHQLAQPPDKIVRNLCTFLCQDMERTPTFELHRKRHGAILSFGAAHRPHEKDKENGASSSGAAGGKAAAAPPSGGDGGRGSSTTVISRSAKISRGRPAPPGRAQGAGSVGAAARTERGESGGGRVLEARLQERVWREARPVLGASPFVGRRQWNESRWG